MQLALALDAPGVTALIRRAFPSPSDAMMPRVIEAQPGRIRAIQPYHDGMLRPGGLISGPNQMSLADTASYALILCHLGEQLMAVTSSLTINFLRGARPGDLHAEASFLKLGRRNAVCDVRIWTESPERLASQATVTYALPQ
jgi:uncharacterized protein (TIGR00369 family)